MDTLAFAFSLILLVVGLLLTYLVGVKPTREARRRPARAWQTRRRAKAGRAA